MKEVFLAFIMYLGLPVNMPMPLNGVVSTTSMGMAIHAHDYVREKDGTLRPSTKKDLETIPISKFVKVATNTFGLYLPNIERIYINDESISRYAEHEKWSREKAMVFRTGVLLHEFYHHWQNMGWEIRKAPCKGAVEAEAYKVQNKYYRDMGYPELQADKMWVLIMGSCRAGF